jgi:hypothetical protein
MSKPDTTLHFVIKMALRNALKLVPGLRKLVGDIDEDVMASKLLLEVDHSNYEIVRRSGSTGHTFEAPAGDP